jgi:RNA polymerase sigma-70 factor (ECF subfamily)
LRHPALASNLTRVSIPLANCVISLPFTGKPAMEDTRVVESEPAIARLTVGLVAADEEAFREFHACYCDRLHHFLLVVCRGSDDEAEEALQLTLLRVVRHARVFHSADTFWCWLKALARSAACDVGRKQRRYAGLLDRFARWWGLQAPRCAPETDPLAGQIETLLADLEPVERRLLEGKYLAGESVKELADQTGLSEKAVEGRLTRTRQRLRERLLIRLNPHDPDAAER